MTTFGLRQAAIQAGTSKSPILRAIQSGRLSAARTDDGGYAIHPAELFRVYPPKPSTDADQSDESPRGTRRTTCRDLRRIGPLVGLVVHPADIQDRDGAPGLLRSIRSAYPWLRHIFADGGYAGPKLKGALDKIGRWTLVHRFGGSGPARTGHSVATGR